MAPPTSSRLSQSLSLRIAANVFGTIFIGFGINAILNPLSALSFFELAPPPSSSSSYYDYTAATTTSSSPSPDNITTLIDSLMIVYGARDIFMGLAIYAAAAAAASASAVASAVAPAAAASFRGNKALGWILIAGSGVAFVDGGVCKWVVGKGEWNHWGYAPVLTAVGLALLGVLD